jgi:hypothetical protein
VEKIGPGETQTHDVLLYGDAYNQSIDAIEDGKAYTNVTANSNHQNQMLNIASLDHTPSAKEITDFGKATVTSSYYGSARAATTITESMVPVKNIVPEDTPSNWICLTALNTVFVSSEAWQKLHQQQQEAIRHYAGWGGQVLVYEADENSSEPLGAGVLVRSTENPLKTPPRQVPENWKWVQDSYGSELTSSNYPGQISTPWSVKPTRGRWGGLALATLYLIIVGPLNYGYFRRKNRIRMIVISTPVISCAFCGIIVIFFLFTQGFSTRISTLSLTTLDEKTDQAFAVSVHSFFSGIYPLSGFHFNRETYVMPIDPLSSSENGRIQSEMDGEIHIIRGLVNSGVESTYATFLPFKTRERLVWDDTTHNAMNGFDLPAEKLYVETSSGLYAGGPAQPGEKVLLKPVRPPEDNPPGGTPLLNLVIAHLPENCRSPFGQGLAPMATSALYSSGTRYAMFFSKDPPQATAGVKRDVGQGIHVLIGALDSDSEGRSR